MVATCGAGAMVYILPMLLGRTYDMRQDTVGIDIFSEKDVQDAMKDPIDVRVVNSEYMTIDTRKERRDFLQISGEFAVKIASGLVDVKGAGEYLKDAASSDDRIEILIKLSYTTEIWKLSPDARPLQFWQFMDPNLVGTHVVNQLTFGGTIMASVVFTAIKEEYKDEIKAEVQAGFHKSGAFDIDAQGKLESLAQNLSSKAKMEMNYYATVPLKIVPTTIEQLRELVSSFRELVESVNNGLGVVVCVEFRALEEFNDKFRFLKDKALLDSMESFSELLDNLREARGILTNLVKSLPVTVPKEYFDKVIDFSGRLTKTIRAFYEVIGNLDIEAGSGQLSPALNAFDRNSNVKGSQRYTKEITQIARENVHKEDPNYPRSVYVLYGKTTCGNKASKPLYKGYLSSFIEEGIGAGTNYICLPENPNLNTDSDAVGLNARTSKLGAVRYMNMSMFKLKGKEVEGKVTPCVVCETPGRPTVEMFPSTDICPGDWVPEYSGYIVGNVHGKLRSECICVHKDPDVYDISTKSKAEPNITPVKVESSKNSIPCAVCSK